MTPITATIATTATTIRVGASIPAPLQTVPIIPIIPTIPVIHGHGHGHDHVIVWMKTSRCIKMPQLGERRGWGVV